MEDIFPELTEHVIERMKGAEPRLRDGVLEITYDFGIAQPQAVER